MPLKSKTSTDPQDAAKQSKAYLSPTARALRMGAPTTADADWGDRQLRGEAVIDWDGRDRSIIIGDDTEFDWYDLISYDRAVRAVSTYADNARKWIESQSDVELDVLIFKARNCQDRNSFVAYRSVLRYRNNIAVSVRKAA